MSDEMKQALGAEVIEDAPAIRFELDGKEYEMPRSIPVRVMVRLYMTVDGDSPEEQMLNFAEHAEDAVCWLVGLDKAALRRLPPDEHARVVDATAELIGKELADARPFSSAQEARKIINRAGKLGKAMVSAGGAPAS